MVADPGRGQHTPSSPPARVGRDAWHRQRGPGIAGRFQTRERALGVKDGEERPERQRRGALGFPSTQSQFPKTAFPGRPPNIPSGSEDSRDPEF